MQKIISKDVQITVIIMLEEGLVEMDVNVQEDGVDWIAHL